MTVVCCVYVLEFKEAALANWLPLVAMSLRTMEAEAAGYGVALIDRLMQGCKNIDLLQTVEQTVQEFIDLVKDREKFQSPLRFALMAVETCRKLQAEAETRAVAT
eukprot:jgi/Hompol1/5252/HPOL_004278-RA